MENKFIIKFSGDTAQLQGAVQKANATITGFANQVRSMANVMAAGFAASEIAGFVMDVSKLAGEAEGVRAAFDKLPNSIMMMKELKEATAGTVSELDLMKRSVMAANFGISLKALPQLLEFAAVRAKQTGQSVDYLADSIVTGIGRKSALILDNLGISLAAINEELKVTPDYAQAVGNIASRELEKMGAMSENASTKMERLNATWINAKVALGEAANGTGVLGAAIDKLTQILDIAASKNIDFWQKLAFFVGGPGAAAAVVAEEFGNATIKANEAQKKQNEITDTASVLLRDLGLDYEALMNVAGDNVNVLEIWAEMQRLAAINTEKSTEEIGKQKKQIVDLANTIRTEIAAINMDELTNSIAKMNLDPLAGIDLSVDLPEEEVDKKVQAVYDRLVARGQRFREAIAETNFIIEQSVEQTIAGFAGALGNLASGVGNTDQLAAVLLAGVGGMAVQLGQLAIATGIAVGGIKKALMSLNPIAAIAGGVALVALGKLVSNKAAKIGSGGGGGVSSSGGGGVSGGASGGLRRTSLGERIVLDVGFTGDAGKVLKAQLIKQDRIDTRTRI